MQSIPAVSESSTGASVMLRMEGISKAFLAARVLKNVDLTLQKGEVHALLGENGAGKSTLMKIMFGVVQPDAVRIQRALAQQAVTVVHVQVAARG